MKVIPVKAQAGIVGFESPAAEYIEMELSLDELLIDKPSATWIGVAQGNSMELDGIFDGDILIISRAQQVKHTSIIVAVLNGVFCCKKIDIERRALISSQIGAKPYFIKEGDGFSLEGVVTRSVRIHTPLNKKIGA
ncbi:DNA polymerase V [Tenacibaculum sp. KUL118]|nr:DNA polymerase V [Tenacibaculum sp. KUL118]